MLVGISEPMGGSSPRAFQSGIVTISIPFLQIDTILPIPRLAGNSEKTSILLAFTDIRGVLTLVPTGVVLTGPYRRQFIPTRRTMLCPELPSRVVWTGTEYANGIAPECGVELVHRSPGPFPLLSVQLAQQGRLPNRFRHQLRSHHAALRVAEAVAPEPFAQAHGQGNHFPGVVGRSGEPCRGSVRVERGIVQGRDRRPSGPRSWQASPQTPLRSPKVHRLAPSQIAYAATLGTLFCDEVGGLRERLRRSDLDAGWDTDPALDALTSSRARGSTSLR